MLTYPQRLYIEELLFTITAGQATTKYNQKYAASVILHKLLQLTAIQHKHMFPGTPTTAQMSALSGKLIHSITLQNTNSD